MQGNIKVKPEKFKELRQKLKSISQLHFRRMISKIRTNCIVNSLHKECFSHIAEIPIFLQCHTFNSIRKVRVHPD
jgi:hypothetical protein